MTTRPTLLLLSTAAILACSSGSRSSLSLPTPIPIDRAPRLQQVGSCEELEQRIEDAAVLQMKSTLEQTARWSSLALDGGEAGGATAPATGSGGPTSYTTTNTQVAGVDEADLVQNDGTRMAVLAGTRLHLLRTWPADALSEASSLEIEGSPLALFLAGDQVVVFSAIDGSGYAGCSLYTCGVREGITKISVVDVTDLSAPKVSSQLYLPGNYAGARRVGARVRLVLNDYLTFPENVEYWPTGLGRNAGDRERQRAFAALEARNEALIRARTLGDWLRPATLQRGDGTVEELGGSCTDFSAGPAPSVPGILTVATIDLDAGTLVSRTSLLSRADVLYASAKTLYVATAHWWWWLEPGQTDATYVHAFDLSDPDRAPYLGSGTVEGYVSDPYKLDELEGHLRVASTLRTRTDADPWSAVETSNQLAVLALSEGALRTVGKTEPFGAGEQLYGTRFLGTRGFAIAARQVDPLFTFDLSDPTAPRTVGELAMPGFIAYLHPIDATHLLGVGREPGPDGAQRLKVQLLDVSDLAQPRSGAMVLVGESASWSEALWDPKAFTWFPDRSLLAIPFYDGSSQRPVNELRLFQVDVARGIAPAGALSMQDLVVQVQPCEADGWSWSPLVRRSVMADDFVYAISDGGVRSASVPALPVWLRTVKFE